MSGRIFRSALLLTAITATGGVGFFSGRASAAPAVINPVTVSQTGGGGVCYHTAISDYVCPDSMMMPFLFPPDYIQEVDLTVTTRNGMRRTIKLPSNADGVFLTRAATEKFLLSYYWAVNRDKADRLHNLLARPTR